MSRPKGSKNRVSAKPPVKPVLKCLMCGKSYENFEKYFPSVPSELYKGNQGRLGTCINCLDSLLEKYYNELGSDYKAMKRLCSKFDIYWNERIFASATANNASDNFIKKYIATAALNPYTGKTYTNTLMEEEVANNTMDREIAKAIRSIDENKDIIAPDVYNRWGLGYSTDELKTAEDRYQTLLRDMGGDVDETEKTLLMDLIGAEILKGRAMKEGDVDKYSKCSKMYRDILKETSIKDRRDNTRNDDEATWGNYIKEVEQYTPADLYSRKDLFDDADNIWDYFQRFIVRPVVNFFTGQRDMDSEYSIGSGD